ncbi:MAG: DNA polymerase III subunit gamma/tau, partial [Planctomycetaceae bacterium]
GEGVQPVDLLNGVLEYLRDAMVLAAGAEATLLAATPSQRPRLQAVVERWPLDSVLAALQIVAEARGRLRGSPLGRLLVELALVRVARLENLSALSDMVTRLAALETGAPAPASGNSSVKKKLAPRDPPPAVPSAPESPPRPTPREDGAPASERNLSLDTARQAWPEVIKKVGAGLGFALSQATPTAISGPNVLVIGLSERYNWVVEKCDTGEARARIEQALQHVLHEPLTVRFELALEDAKKAPETSSAPLPRRDVVDEDPMVKKVVELFEARPLHLEFEEDSPHSFRP